MSASTTTHPIDRVNEGLCKSLAMSSVLQHYVCDERGREVDVTPEYLRWYFIALEQQLNAAKDALDALIVGEAK